LKLIQSSLYPSDPQDIGHQRSRRRTVIAAEVVYSLGCRELRFGGGDGEGGTVCSQIKSLTTGSRRVSVSRSPRNALAMRAIQRE